MDQIVLSVPALLPLIGGLALLFVSQFGPLKKAEGAADGRTRRDRLLQLYVEGIALANSLVLLWLVFSASGEGVVLFRLYGELKVMFRLDGMGRVFAGLIGVLWPLAVLYAFEYMKEERRKAAFFAYYLMTYGITAGIALAGNLMTLYLFYELLTLATFPLVLFPLTREAARASRKYLYYSIGGAAFAFLGLVFVLYFSSTGNTAFSAGGMLDLEAAGQHKDLLLFIYLLAFYGFGVKAVVFPCHKWLPPATVAPTPVTALLHAVAVVKSGAFAILRLTYYSFGAGFLKDTWAQWVVMAAAMMTIAYGSTMAAKEAHWKRRLAYSTVSNLSYILLGASMMSPLGLAAALSHMVFHAFMKICAFFCAGAVMHQTGKTHVYELDGLGRRMPVTFGCLTVASLSLTGIPLFAGFISKWNIARAAFTCGMGPTVPLGGMVGYLGTGGWRLLAFGAVAVLLYSALMTGIYMLTVVIRAYFPKVGAALTAAAGEGGDGPDKVAGQKEVSSSGVAAEGCGGPGQMEGQLSGGARVSGASGGACVAVASGGAGSGTEQGQQSMALSQPAADSGNCDPNWMMLAPLLLFAAAIILMGVHSAPLMEIFMQIGGEAG